MHDTTKAAQLLEQTFFFTLTVVLEQATVTTQQNDKQKRHQKTNSPISLELRRNTHMR